MLDDIMGELGGSDDVTEEPKTYTHHRKPVARKPPAPSTSSQWRKPQMKKRMSTSSMKQNRPQQVKMSPAKPSSPPSLSRKPVDEPVEIKVSIEINMKFALVTSYNLEIQNDITSNFFLNL